jgi:hypothetical protein
MSLSGLSDPAIRRRFGLVDTQDLEAYVRKEDFLKLQEENKSLHEEVKLLRQSVVEILEVLVMNKSRTNLKEPVATTAGASKTVQLSC